MITDDVLTTPSAQSGMHDDGMKIKKRSAKQKGTKRGEKDVYDIRKKEEKDICTEKKKRCWHCKKEGKKMLAKRKIHWSPSAR